MVRGKHDGTSHDNGCSFPAVPIMKRRKPNASIGAPIQEKKNAESLTDPARNFW